MESNLLKKEIKRFLLSEQPPNLILCKGTLICSAAFYEFSVLPPCIKELLKEFGDVVPKEGPIELRPFKGIAHEIDLFLGAILPNRSAYRTNLDETKEIEY